MSTHNSQVVDEIAMAVTEKGQFMKSVAGGFTPCTVLGEKADAVSFSDAGVGQAVGIQVGQKVLVKVGAAPIADNAEVTTNALGLAITAVSTNNVRLRSTEAGAAGAYMECNWIDSYVKA